MERNGKPFAWVSDSFDYSQSLRKVRIDVGVEGSAKRGFRVTALRVWVDVRYDEMKERQMEHSWDEAASQNHVD